MPTTSLEINLTDIEARWVVVGFGVDDMMARLPETLRQLGPHSIRFPETIILSLGVPRLSDAAKTSYIVVVASGECSAKTDAREFIRDRAGSGCMAVLMAFGDCSVEWSVPLGMLHLSMPQSAGGEMVVAALLLAATGNGFVGVDFSDIRDCLHARGPVRVWLWRGLCTQTIADAARDLAQFAAEAGMPPTGMTGATVMAIVPPSWTLHDIVELTGNLRLPEAVDCAMAAFTDDGPDPAPAVVAFTYSPLQIG